MSRMGTLDPEEVSDVMTLTVGGTRAAARLRPAATAAERALAAALRAVSAAGW